jgi:hypothetical protein
MAEFAPTLLIAFTIIVFPLLAFGTIGMRYVFLVNAARQASQAACRCPQFLNNITQTISGVTTTQLSAVNTALMVSKYCLNNIGGNTVQWVSTNTFIYICPMGSSTMTTPGANKSLTSPADPTNFTYDCVVVVGANIQPIFPGFSAFYAIPGLNSPFYTSAQTESVFETTSNLNN